MLRRFVPIWLLLAVAASGCSGSESGPQTYSDELTYELVATYPHKTSSFTQGLEVTADGRLVESLGRLGESARAIVDIETGAHLANTDLPPDLFGEGITEVDDELFQLTWKGGQVIVSDSQTLAEKRRYNYQGEGWGLCHDGENLVMSNGSEELTTRSTETFDQIRSVRVTASREELLGQLNELECVGSQVWANVYFKHHLLAIDLETGKVEAWVDLEDLVPDGLENLDVLNGIAYKPDTETFLVTGKNWPVMYELRFS